MPSAQLIHPTAIVEDGALLGRNVRIGPFCHIGPEAVIGDDVEMLGYAVVCGATTIGEGTRIHQHAALGGQPQNVKHKGGRTTLNIGKNCVIRESVTMNVGTDTSRGRTVVGDGGMFMAYAHVAHDCIVGSNVTFANSATLGGHCEVGDGATIGGLTAVHQFVRIGHHAFIGGCSAVVGDIIPYALASGNRAKLFGFNVVGMKRAGFARADLMAMRQAYRMIFDGDHALTDNLDRAAAEFGDKPVIAEVIAFIRSRGRRYLAFPAGQRHGKDEDAGEAD